MTFLAPIAGLIAAGIAVPLLVVLYFLKMRRRTVDVSTTLLWRKAIRDLRVNAPFQRLRRNLLFLLQLLILMGLILALARPAFHQLGPPGQRTVILIDRSGSMNATDVTPTRLEAAKESALKLVDELPDAGASGDNPTVAGGGATSGGASGGGASGGGGVMIITFARQAQVVQSFTTDPSLLRAAIRAIQPSDESTHLEAALRLIAPFAAQSQGHPLAVYLLSDGRVEDQAALSLPGAQVILMPIPAPGRSAGPVDNLGFVDLVARRDIKRPEMVDVFARLANYGPSRVDTNVTLRVDGVVQRVTRTFVPPPLEGALAGALPGAGAGAGAGGDEPGFQSLHFELDLPGPGAALIELSHDHPDQLSSDDHAAVLVTPPRQLRVLLVNAGNGLLEQAIRAVGVRRLVGMTPEQYEQQEPRRLRSGGWEASAAGSEGFDVIVFDRYSPRREPQVNSLFFAGVPPVTGLVLRGSTDAAGAPGNTTGEAESILDWRRDDPLMRYVELDDVMLIDPARLALPDGARVLATCQGGPVMGQLSVNGVQYVFTSFNLDQARSWAMQVSFPIFMSNALNWLGLGGQTEAGVSYRPGDVAVTPASGDEVIYTGPELLEAPVVQGRAVLPAFTLAGIYQAQAGSGVELSWDRLPVNLADARESDIRPIQSLRIGSGSAVTVATSQTTRRETWRWFVWAALAVLMLEWVVYTRRMGE